MKFQPNDEFEYAGVFYRVRAGSRCEGDMTIEFSVDGGINWHMPRIAHTLILASFKFQVEENNYGSRAGKLKRGRGGWLLLDAIKSACRNGWHGEARKIENSREASWFRAPLGH